MFNISVSSGTVVAKLKKDLLLLKIRRIKKDENYEPGIRICIKNLLRRTCAIQYNAANFYEYKIKKLPI